MFVAHIMDKFGDKKTKTCVGIFRDLIYRDGAFYKPGEKEPVLKLLSNNNWYSPSVKHIRPILVISEYKDASEKN